MQVLVRDNNVDQALKALKKKMQREGIFREMKLRGHYEKPSEKKAREKAEAIRRARKLARKKMQREGLLPMKPRVVPGAAGPGGPGGPGGGGRGRGGPPRFGGGARLRKDGLRLKCGAGLQTPALLLLVGATASVAITAETKPAPPEQSAPAWERTAAAGS